MGRPSTHPFKIGTAERVLYDRWKKATGQAEVKEREAAIAMTEAKSHRAAGEQYAAALRALGHGDKVPGQTLLPNYAALGESEVAEQAGFKPESLKT
jgi:hypothetical protein